MKAASRETVERVGTALEDSFPSVSVSVVARQESWRKEINRPLYHIHKWWATRLGTVFRAITLGALSPAETDTWSAFYERHALTDKIVLDPFMGSGTTIGEALKLGARAIGCDVNPVSTFLVRQALTRVSEQRLREVFGELERTVAPEIRRYYQTEDPETGTSIPVLYYFWVKTVTTPAGETIPLFNRYVFAQDAYASKKPRAHMVCRTCWGLIEGRYDAREVTCKSCGDTFNPQAGPAAGQKVTDRSGTVHRIKSLIPQDRPPEHRMYAMLALRPNGEKVYLPVRPDDLALLQEAEDRLRTENLPLPTLDVREGTNTNQARGYNYLRWSDFFGPRQLLTLGLLLRAILDIEDIAVQEQMLCLFSSTLEFNNLFCSYKGEGTGAVRHMFSHHILKPERVPLENSVWGTPKSSGTFSTLFESRLLAAKRYLDNPFEVQLETDLFGEGRRAVKTTASPPIHANPVEGWTAFEADPRAVLVLNGDSAALPIPDRTVDAVITDPPYFDFVHYSELSDFFFAWLSPALRARYPWFKTDDCSNPGEVQHKDPQTFGRLLARVFSECRRVLKDDGVLAFSFHHSRPEGWAAIHRAVVDAGLSIVAAHPVHGELQAASPKAAAKDPISLDAILVCRKQTFPQVPFDADRVALEVRRRVRELVEGGIVLTTSDTFVIAASQMLVGLPGGMDFDAVARLIEDLSPTFTSADLIAEPPSAPPS